MVGLCDYETKMIFHVLKYFLQLLFANTGVYFELANYFQKIHQYLVCESDSIFKIYAGA